MPLQLNGSQPESVFFPHNDRTCPACGSLRWYGYKSSGRRFYRLAGLLFAECQLVYCRIGSCPLRFKPMRPPQLEALAPSSKGYGYDVIARVGHLRFAEKLSRAQIHERFKQDHPAVVLSERQVQNLYELYGALASGSVLENAAVIEAVKKQRALVLAVDGAKPMRENDSVWFVRDLLSGTILAAEAMSSCTTATLAKLLEPIKAFAKRIGVPVVGVITDKERINVLAVRQVFPRARHQYCQLHFVSNLAKPILKADSALRAEIKESMRDLGKVAKKLQAKAVAGTGLNVAQSAIVDDLITGIRSVLRDGGKPPFAPPGLRLLERLTQLRDLVQNMQREKGGPKSERWRISLRSWTGSKKRATRSNSTFRTSGLSRTYSSQNDGQRREPSAY